MSPHRPSQSTNRRPSTPALDSARRGFTLVELMVVIVIIAVLVGIITPAVMAAMRRARISEVRTEISQFDSAIGAFKTEFGGVAPPSSISFPSTANVANWNTATYARSRAIIRRLWPQFDFTTNGGGAFPSDTTLNGAECLVFFLGGVREGGALVGFSKNPSSPFSTGGSRVGPFFDFKGGYDTAAATPSWSIGRLVDLDSDEVPEYLDPLPGQSNPYVYLSSYDGNGYRSSDSSRIAAYTQPGGSPAYNPKSHQIISPGFDADYGSGGEYNSGNYTVADPADGDNITNFADGLLVP